MLRTRPGPADPALRQARVCYDHLAGEAGVALFDALVARRVIAGAGDDVRLTKKGEDFVRGFGIDIDALKSARRRCAAPAWTGASAAATWPAHWARRWTRCWRRNG